MISSDEVSDIFHIYLLYASASFFGAPDRDGKRQGSVEVYENTRIIVTDA